MSEYDLFFLVVRADHDSFTATVMGWEDSPRVWGRSRTEAVAELVARITELGEGALDGLESPAAWIRQVQMQFPVEATS